MRVGGPLPFRLRRRRAGLDGADERLEHDFSAFVVVHVDTRRPEPECRGDAAELLGRFLAERGNVEQAEMRRVFNMGIGYCLIVRPNFADATAKRLAKMGERVHTIGRIVKGTGKVVEKPRRKRR